MSNPFPGMNPYLERKSLWEGVHHRLITYAANHLQRLLRPRYYVSLEERMYVVETAREIQPDVALKRHDKPRTGSVAVLEATYDPPLVLQIEPMEHTEGYIHILDRERGMRLVTVIELLSPTNKEPNSQGRALYLRKQAEILKSDVHLVEIDLLRDGEYTLAAPLGRLREQVRQPWHYLVSIRRADEPERFLLYPRTVRERLPVIPIPLAIGEGEVALDLQALFNQCYEDGAYGDVVDYRELPPPPPFSAEDVAWMDALLRQKGLR
ncbi:MAG: DUF4058 family protein [Fimbriimonadales bacterium]|nr:DUF4058 family protein [Fimbriimonadales bacterium]